MAFVVVGIAACAGSDHDIGDQVTIDQGVFGLLLKGCDTAGCRVQVGSGVGITLELPPPAGSVHGESLDSTTSNSHGVYQFDLPAGHYQLCTTSCTPIDVPDGGTARYDWVSGSDGGAWCAGGC